MLEGILASPIVHAIGWALIAFTWQAALIGAATALALRMLSRADSRLRYAVACAALVAMTTLPVATAVRALAGDRGVVW